MADDLDREEEQVEESQPEETQPQEPPSGTGQPEDDDLDIDLGPAMQAQPGSRGCRTTTVILLIVLLVAAAASILYVRHVREVREAELRAQMEREEQYKSWLGHVAADVSEAIEKANAGQMPDALALLDRAEAKLTTIGTHANDANDQQWAAFAMSKKSTLLEVKKAIAEAYESYQAVVDEQLAKLGGKFSGIDFGAGTPTRPGLPTGPPAEVAPAEEAPAADLPAEESVEGPEAPAPEAMETPVAPDEAPPGPPE